MIKKRQIVTSLRAAFQPQAMEKWAMGSKPFGEKHHHGGCWDENSDDQWWLMMVTKLYKPKHPRVTNRVARSGRNTGVANLGIIVMALRNKMICWWWFWCVYQLWFDMKSRLRKSENNDHDYWLYMTRSPICKSENDCENTEQADHSDVNSLKQSKRF